MNSKSSAVGAIEPAVELTELLAHPGNQVALPALMALMRSNMPPVPFIGSKQHSYSYLPDWTQFLMGQAAALGATSAEPMSDDALEASIVSAAGQLYLDDAVEMAYGRQRMESPVRRSMPMVPYLTRDLVATTNDISDVRHAFEQANRELRVISSSFNSEITMLRYYVDEASPIKRAILVGLREADDRQNAPRKPEIGDVDGVAAFISFLTMKTRSLLFIGMPPDGFPMMDALLTLPAAVESHFALLSEEMRNKDLVRFLYTRRIRPIWYSPDTEQLELLLVRLAEAMLPQGIVAPATWPVSVAQRKSVPIATPSTPATDQSLPPLSPPQEVIDACLRNECVAFIGSGLAARAGLPTWRGFVEGLVNETVALNVMTERAARNQHAALAEGEVNAVADNAISAFGEQSADLLDYYRRASTPAANVPLPSAYAQLRKIPFAGVLTTNYDSLLSQAYAGSGFLDGLTPRDSEQLLSLLSARTEPFLLQLYGNLDQPESVVFAPSDYHNLVRSNAAFGRFIEGLFFSRTMLFIGTSLQGLVDYLNAFQFPSGVPRQHYALVAVQGGGWQAKAQTLKRRYNIEVLPFPVSLDFPEVDDFLARLAAQTAHPKPAARAPSTSEAGPQLLRLELMNIGPFKHLVFDFSRTWKVLLGDNGVGKSTILKSIAVAIVGSEGKQYAGRLLRAGETLGSVTLVTQKNPSGYVAEIQRIGLDAEVITRSGRVLEAEGWVALAFPPLRATSWVPARGPQGLGARHPTAADLLPILSGDVDSRMDDLKQWIVNTDALRRKEGATEEDRQRAERMLRTFFDIVGKLTEGLLVEFKEVTSDFRVLVETPDGVVPIESLSQGLTSLLSWIGIVVQRLYEVSPLRPDVDDAMQGYALILMDEIDAHMHPAWQQRLVGKLKQILPNVQVIASTHSPLVVAGLDVDEVTRFARDDAGAVVQLRVDVDMTEGRTDQILTGDLFGLNSTFTLTQPTAALMDEYKQLLGKSLRTVEEDNRFAELHKLLDTKMPPAGAESKLERRTQELVHAILSADYSSDNRDSLRRELFDKTQSVAISMGWTEMLVDKSRS